MPGIRPRKNPVTRLMSSSTRRAPVPAGGVGIARVPRVSDRSSGSGGTGGIFGELHYIEGWTIADDSDDTFQTTYKPLSGSWNLMLNGVRVHRDEFTIAEKVLTISDPTDLFLGADTQGSPWDLEIQYDYLRGPVATPVPISSSREGTGGTLDAPWPTGMEAGDVVVALYSSGPGSAAPTMPAGFVGITGADLTAQGIRVFEYTADGTETGDVPNISLPSGAGFHEIHLLNYRNIGSLGSASTDGPTSGIGYTVPAATGLPMAIRFVIAFANATVPIVGSVTADYSATGTLMSTWPMAYHEGAPPSRTAALSPAPGSPIDWASITIGVS